jgi:hypothetical protein
MSNWDSERTGGLWAAARHESHFDYVRAEMIRPALNLPTERIFLRFSDFVLECQYIDGTDAHY